MQYTSLILALAATVSAQINNAVVYNSADGNTNTTIGDVDAVANAGNNFGGSDNSVGSGNSGYPSNGGYDPECVTIVTHPGTKVITDLTVSTYCPVCDDAKTKGNVYTTTYETVYPSLCPTGLIDVTYTVTQTCTGTTPIDYATPAPGYDVVTKVCDTCPEKPTYTYTAPCDSCATPAVTPYATGKPTYPASTYTGAASSVAISAFAGVAALSFFGMLLL